jgi:glycosyltransferase involved in cell wall biosynthesis
MNILFLARDINIKGKAGDSVHVRELIKALAKLGHNVYLIVPQIEGNSDELDSLKAQQNVRIYFIRPKRHLKDISTISLCKKIAKDNEVDIIYERRVSGKISYLLSEILNIPHLLEINGLPELESKMLGKTSEQNAFGEKIRKRLRRHIYIHTNKIVAVTEGIKVTLAKDYRLPLEKIIVVPNGANVDLFRKKDMMQCKQKLGLENHKKYVCFSGNLAPWQGVDNLIRAAPKVIEKVPEAMFIIVGDGIMCNDLKRIAESLNIIDKFIFTGWVSYYDVPTYINSSEICVVPSSTTNERNKKTGGSSLKIYEYLACEKPVITGDLEGNKDLILEANAGYVVSPENTSQLAEAIINLIRNHELSEEMGKNGRRFVIEHNSWEVIAKKIVNVCENVIENVYFGGV